MKRLPIVLIFISLCLTLSTGSCGSDDRPDEKLPADTIVEEEDYEQAIIMIDSLLGAKSPNPWQYARVAGDEVPTTPLETHPPVQDWEEIFPWDLGGKHYYTARALGIRPIDADTFNIAMRQPLQRVEATQYYYIDNLTHSYPYLIPEAHELLNEIGRRFHDSLQVRGGATHRLKVTSMLRTHNSISSLRQVNDASVDSSSHLFGTTFDISINNFGYTGGEPVRSRIDLRRLLAEVLYDLLQQNRCYVIYEEGPGCFHVTTRLYRKQK